MDKANLRSIEAKKESIIKYQFNAFCTCFIVLLSTWAIPSTLELPNYITNLYYLLAAINFIIYIFGFFSLGAFSFLAFYSATIITSFCLVSFLVGLLSQDPNLINQGIALGIPLILSLPILIVSMLLIIQIFYKIYKEINLTQYSNKILEAHNYDIQRGLYFINHHNNEPILKFNILNKFKTNEYFIAAIIMLIPIGTGSAYITLMSTYNPFALNHIIFYASLPAFLIFAYATIICYIKYISYVRLQRNLGVKLKPAVKN